MSDLPSGSTVGGKLIIHKGTAKSHRHHVSEIEGLNGNAGRDQGDGGGIDADVLSGKTFNDLNNEFLNVSNDSISEIRLSSHPTMDAHAASKLYVSQRASEGFTNGDFYGLTSIGTVSQELSYVVLNSYVVRINETDIMVNGWLGVLPEQNIDIRDISTNYTNKSFYLYVNNDENSFTITGSETKELNTNSKIFVGRIDTNSSGITNVEIVSGVSRFGIGKYMLSQTPEPNSVVISKSSGVIDDGWIVGSSGETQTFLLGPTAGRSSNTLEYRITNYCSFSTYTVSVDNPELSVSISEDDISVSLPTTIPYERDEKLYVRRDGFVSSFTIRLVSDPAPEISGPSSIQSGEAFVYTIDNYNEYYSYDVSSNMTGITVSSVIDNEVTITTSNTNPYTQNGYIEVSHSGSSTQLPVTFEADPAITLSGPDELYPDKTYNFTIGNYNPSYSYSVSSSHGTVSRSGNTVVLNTSGITTSDPETSISVTVSRQGSSATFNTTFINGYVLNAPEDFNPNTISGSINLPALFHEKYGIGYYWYGSVLVLPDANYTVNISPNSGTDIIYNEVGGSGSSGLNISTYGISAASELTIVISGKIVGRGGDAGGFYDFSIKERGSPTVPQHGGHAIKLNYHPNIQDRTTPIKLDIRNAELYPGGGGGDCSYHIVVSTDNRDPAYVNDDGSYVWIREGVIAGASGGKSAFDVPDGATSTSQALDSYDPASALTMNIDYVNQPTFVGGGEVRYYNFNYSKWTVHRGAVGGDVGQDSILPNTSWDDEMVSYSTYRTRSYYSSGNPNWSTYSTAMKQTYGGKEIKFYNDDDTGYQVIR